MEMKFKKGDRVRISNVDQLPTDFDRPKFLDQKGIVRSLNFSSEGDFSGYQVSFDDED